jgi:hypothetical protein
MLSAFPYAKKMGEKPMFYNTFLPLPYADSIANAKPALPALPHLQAHQTNRVVHVRE